ncbi:fibronectin type III domain-containing protein [bacterium]|nr:fibronectin type III domain-containing protein [bacterium]
MPRFPRREGEIILLADDMISGLNSYGKHFPNCDPKGLEGLRADYQKQKDVQMDALNAYKAATEAKDEALQELMRKMKDELKQAEDDSKQDPSKLERIGWGGLSEVTVTPPPAPPRDLEAVSEGAAGVRLQWRQPARGQGGPVRVYEVERREGADKSTEWTLEANSFDLELRMKELPVGIPLRFRVRARNQAGASDPSNTVEITL